MLKILLSFFLFINEIIWACFSLRMNITQIEKIYISKQNTNMLYTETRKKLMQLIEKL